MCRINREREKCSAYIAQSIDYKILITCLKKYLVVLYFSYYAVERALPGKR